MFYPFVFRIKPLLTYLLTEPTSFHQDGSQIRQQLLDHHRSTSVQRPPPTRHDYERRCRRTRRRRHRRRRVGLQPTVVDSTTSDSEMASAGRNWRLSPSPVFHLLHHHHQATYCVNSNKDTQLNSPNGLLIDSSAETDSHSYCQVNPHTMHGSSVCLILL